MKKVYVIAGPTAGGKSNFALQLAQSIHGQIINADSMQIYRDLSIISARPTPADTQGIPHHLYGYLDAWTQGTVQDWLTRAVPLIQELPNPILVGGTGLYLSCLINGINSIPDIDPDIRKTVREMDIESVRTQVKDCVFTDPQRLRRSLEVQLSTGKPLSYWQNQPKKHVLTADFQTFFINPPRPILYQNCERRFDQMLAQGALAEVENLRRLKPTGGVLKAIGVPEIMLYLKKNISKDEMRQRVILSTRHYAKRQITWFKHQLPDYTLIENPATYPLS